ncbi:putative acetyltransferase protein [Fulvimarina pelagi HTCC2506]|uniref:Putative acetyltransferase protein n=1 Tax=Fulvimarina pelagi HTCC2506 TaxID=314231 RepID=Q0G5X5_9HYPH|nr:GNAT family N-acetyltransferase [Fulvimarina pelagi]EAU42939.1 putative acetyltransferase protein [Fulvimarina pelagi HTCC2506]
MSGAHEAPRIRSVREGDADAIWRIVAPIIRDGETYALERDMSRAEALAYWCGDDRRTFVAESEGAILGTYYLKQNQPGGGSHVANCGYAVAAEARGRGIARVMAEHSLNEARDCGFKAMQFNFVVATNTGAIGLWHSLGFTTVGKLNGAFAHPREGFVDALVMWRNL